MKIERIALRNYRGITRHEVTLSDGITIIEGANEAGKSSLAEAVDLLIRYLDSSQDGNVDAVRPVHTGLSPEAEIDLRVGQYRFTYRKRWSVRRDAETILRIIEPTAEAGVIRGRAAHDRAQQILKENADLDLWAALRVMQSEGHKGGSARQRTALDQPALGGKSALMRALDLAAGGDAASAHDERCATLLEAVEKELGYYFTSKRRIPSGDYAKAIEAEKAAREEAHRRQSTLDQVTDDIESHRRCEEKLRGLKKAARDGAPLLADLKHEYTLLAEAARAADALKAAAALATAEASAAESRLTTRQDLRKDAQSAQGEAAELAQSAEKLESESARKQAEALTADSAAASADDAKAEVDKAAAAAVADREYLRQLDELAALRHRRARADGAAQRIVESTTARKTIQITKAGLAQLEKEHDKFSRAQAVLAAASSLVEISALDGTADLLVELDGRTERLAADGPGAFVRRLVDATTLTLDERIRLRITPGNGESGQRAKLDKHRAELNALLGSLGVADIEDAREQYARRGDLERQLEVARTEVEAALGGHDLDTVTARIVELNARTGQYRAGRGSARLPDSLDAAETAMDAAAEQAKQRGSEAGQARIVATTLREAAQRAETEARVARVLAKDSAAKAQRLQRKLETARAEFSDSELQELHRSLSSSAEIADHAWRAAAATFNAAALEDTHMRLENLREVIKRREGEIHACDIERARLETSLANDRDARERLDEAQERLDSAEHTLDGFRRRAEAARLLHDTLVAQRDAAKRAYVEPFRTKLEHYARVVYGEPELELLVNDDLAVTHRVVRGARVPFEDLSGGAQEQLALCSRLACAALVDPADGVPVVIDDALGFTDPDRLGRIGAVFSKAGVSAQIVILTCTPGRYQGIGRAKVIPLRASTASAVDPLGALVGLDGASRFVEDGGEGPAGALVPAADAAAAVLRVLRDADMPLGRADLVARAGIPVEQWPSVIRSLLDDGRVEQRGERRGARYTASVPDSPVR